MRDFLKKYGIYFLIFIFFLFVIFLFYFDFSYKKDNLTFAMLDVGQGDSIFIETEDGTQILIDAGKNKKVLSELSKVIPFYDRSIDIIIMTNPDLDHIGGFLDILKKYKVDKVFEPGTYNDSNIYKEIQNIIKKKNVKHFFGKAGIKIDLGDLTYIDFLFPDRDVSEWENNDGSIVAKLTHGNNEFILMGDATINTEKLILEKYDKNFLESDFIKIGHHGSRTSSSLEFLKAVNPKYSLISSGEGNKYGHPHKEILNILNSLGIEILRTDEQGTIILKCDKMEGCKIKK